jgi:hypothetical protein
MFEPELKYLKELFERSARHRGHFLERACFVERLIEDIIAHDFFPKPMQNKNRMMMLSFIFNEPGLTFRIKTSILNNLLKNRHESILNSHPKLIQRLDEIRELRNHLSHLTLDSSEEFLSQKLEDTLQYFKYEKGREKKYVYKVSEIVKCIEDCEAIISELTKIREEIQKDIK